MHGIAIFALVALLTTSGWASLCPDKDGMSDEVRKAFVDKHNEYRTLVAKGKAKNKLGGNAPPAARMLKMSYDCAIEENMMDYAKQCKFAHNSYKDRNGWGQNLYMTSGRNVNKTRAAENSVSAWFSELEHKGVPKENRLTMEVFNRGVGHYSQVVWQWSKKVGCAVVWCKDMTLVGCEYAQAGNYLGSLIYEIGEPCKEDKDCNCDKCKCDREEALCIPPQIEASERSKRPESKIERPKRPESKIERPKRPDAKIEKSKRPDSKPASPKPYIVEFSKDSGSMCPDKNGMSDEVRKAFVDKHNEYRTLVAKGKAKNKLGGNAPPAARMLKMSYDCAIEENMMNYAKKCKFAHNSYKDRNGWGQNLYMTSGRNVNKTRAAENSVSAWFSELERKGVPKENRLTMEVFNHGVGHYSQVVWQWSNKVGCAVVWCKDMTLVGCEYARAGNYLGSLIYEIGEPCKEDKDCNCDKCKCDREEALCIPPQ
uniref:SCP-like protein n=1 Tax=Haemonchus contortus TaxID=6289 RepID=A0A7I4YS58_HAECO